MNHPQGSHPSLAELQAFDSGQLRPAERGPIERHLEGCSACCEALDASPEGALEALIRAYGGRPWNLESTEPADDGLSAPPDIPAELIGHPRYRILGVLGAGGMGVVYKAIHRLMERVVALKVLNRSLTARPGFPERFHREVKAAARLAHPNIVTAYDAEEVAGTHFLVMEYVPGTTLDRVVARRGPLPVREACALVRQAALGLQHAHERGLVHCDIKPHNLLLTPAGQVKILDFGLARVLEEGRTAAGTLPSATLLGTPDYVAPEQARDPLAAEVRSDIYALGCTFYHLLAGHPPFPAGTPFQKLLAHQECRPPALAAVNENLPCQLTLVLERMLAKDPGQRYPTAAHLVAELERIADPAPATPAAGPRWSSRRAIVAAAGLLALILAVLGLAALPAVWQRLRSPDTAAREPPEPRPGPAGFQASGDAHDPAGLADAGMLSRKQREVRDQAVDWLRGNCLPPVSDPLATDVALHIDKDLSRSEAFQVLLGQGLVKSGKPMLLLGRAGRLHALQLRAAIAGDLPPGSCRVQNYSTGDDRRRAVPRIILADLDVPKADRLFPDRPVTGSVAYRIVERWPGPYALRLTFYFGKRGHRHVFVQHDQLPDAEEGMLRFSFPPLDDANQVMPGPDAVFVEAITQASGRTIVESNAAAAAVRVMPPETPRPK